MLGDSCGACSLQQLPLSRGWDELLFIGSRHQKHHKSMRVCFLVGLLVRVIA